ncbi:DMT family transporter [Thermoflavimicrobium daqui]|uniref:EamA family transporter n=1 Tax=Thermoflavimicrobium daqui TaxID=2137476 RepID=A0A364K4H1_9BACL|nr:EamA family transporter [Thermoflavimicrobium daqui]RAL24265.1 EamA family transporter [Thermoflavimicrobium daqui]
MIIGYLIMCLIFGTTFLVIKLGMTDTMPPFFFAAIRFFLAGALIILYFGFRKKLPQLTWKKTIDIAVVGILMTTIPYAALYWSEQYISSGVAAILVSTGPIFTTILSIASGTLQFRVYLLIGLFFSIAGTVLITGFHDDVVGAFALVSKCILVIAELFFAWGAVRSKKMMEDMSPLVFNGLQLLFASFGLFLLSFLFENMSTISFSPHSIAALFYLTIVASIIALGIFYWLVQKTNAVFPATWTYVAPVIAMIVGAIFLHEKITWQNIFGGISVLIGIVIINWPTWKTMRFHELKGK